MNEMNYDEDSSSIGISSHEKLSDDEKINILISHLSEFLVRAFFRRL